MISYTDKGAIVSRCDRYRYSLWREWRGTHARRNWWWWEDDGNPVLDGAGERLGGPKSCVFIMLNPSTADGLVDDNTVKSCVGFARRWLYERLVVVNLFAYRATDPLTIKTLDLDAAVGPDNQDWIEKAVADAGLIVCAWGNYGSYLGQDQTVLGWLGGAKTRCLGVTNSGHPRHPLYMPRNVKLRRFNPKVG